MNLSRNLGIGILAIFLTGLHGQETTGAIVGTVRDSSGSVVVGAQVSVTRVDTGVETRTTSDSEGSYQFPILRAGTYLLRAEQPGFQKLQRDGIVVNTTERLRVDVALTVGSLTDFVSAKLAG